MRRPHHHSILAQATRYAVRKGSDFHSSYEYGPRIYGSSDHPRGNITLYRSTDGSTWRNVALLYEGSTAPGDGYSSMVNLADGTIGVVFSAGDEILFLSQSVV